MTRAELLQKAKPILFNTFEVQAILEDRKAVTRRVNKRMTICEQLGCHNEVFCYDHEKGTYGVHEFGCEGYEGCQYEDTLPYQKGDIVYVRETWGNWNYDNPDCNACYYQYRADYPIGAKTYEWPELDEFGEKIICDLPKWHPSIHMPKEAARIFLEVTDVRVERLQDITREDCVKEGCIENPSFYRYQSQGWFEYPKEQFSELWDRTIKKQDLDKYSWEANPFVWVIEFRRVNV